MRKYELDEHVWINAYGEPRQVRVSEHEDNNEYELQALPLPKHGEGTTFFSGVSEKDIFPDKSSCLKKMHAELMKWSLNFNKKLHEAALCFDSERKLEIIVVSMYRQINGGL